jgi:hypothetical protein
MAWLQPIREPGTVMIKKYNVAANWESTSSVLQQKALAVQALASDAIDLGPCVFAPTAISLTGAGASAGEAHKYRTFVAVFGADDGQLKNANVKIYRIDWCSASITVSLVQTIAGARYVALTGRKLSTPTGSTQRILVAYERSSLLQGRMMNAAGAWASSEFVIDSESAERRYIDVTWNPGSQRFFLGYNAIGSGFKECKLKQAALTGRGQVLFVRTVHPACDGGSGGHRSSSATDEDRSRNPEGNYLWYSQANGHNQVYLMNRFGDIISAVALGQGNLDLPLPVSLAGMPESTAPSYAVYRVWSAATPPALVASVTATGAFSQLHVPLLGEALALRALQDKLVSAVGVNCQGLTPGQCSTWAISVYDFTRSVADPIAPS